MEARAASHSGIQMKGPAAPALTTAFNCQWARQEMAAAQLLGSPGKREAWKGHFCHLKLSENTCEVGGVELALHLLVHQPPVQF